MAALEAYLSFNDNCEEAFNFYKSVFNVEFAYIGRYKDIPAEEGMTIPDSEKEKIMHVALPILKDVMLMGADTSDSFGRVTFGSNVALCLNIDNESDAKRVFSALSEGGKVDMPLQKTFWAELFGSFVDKFGVGWMVSFTTCQGK